jgi:hypothetical protein
MFYSCPVGPAGDKLDRSWQAVFATGALHKQMDVVGGNHVFQDGDAVPLLRLEKPLNSTVPNEGEISIMLSVGDVPRYILECNAGWLWPFVSPRSRCNAIFLFLTLKNAI